MEGCGGRYLTTPAQHIQHCDGARFNIKETASDIFPYVAPLRLKTLRDPEYYQLPVPRFTDLQTTRDIPRVSKQRFSNLRRNY